MADPHHRASDFEKDLSPVQPITDVPQQCEHQQFLRDRPEISKELEIAGETLQAAVEPAFDADLAQRIGENRIGAEHQERKRPALELLDSFLNHDRQGVV